jgi:hypothetical protein
MKDKNGRASTGTRSLKTGPGCQSPMRGRKSDSLLDHEGQQRKGGNVPILSDKLVAKLEEVDRMIREEIKREVSSNSNNGSASSRLACLMRSRADVQSAITCLLGASQ